MKPTPKPISLPSVVIGSMSAPVVDNNKPIVSGGQNPAKKQDEDPKDAAEVEKKEKLPRDPRYTQPKWCLQGLDKTQRRKLQRARCKKLKREALGIIENQTPPRNPQEISPKVVEAAAAPTESAQLISQTAKPTASTELAKPIVELAKPISFAACGQEGQESAKPIGGSAKPTDTVVLIPANSESAMVSPEASMSIPTGSEDLRESPKDFAAIVAAMMDMEISQVPDEEMVDYEPSPEHGDVQPVDNRPNIIM